MMKGYTGMGDFLVDIVSGILGTAIIVWILTRSVGAKK